MGTNEAHRDKLLSGDPLHFELQEQEEARTILAPWLEEAARKPVRIDVRNAVISGPLNMKYTTFEEEVLLIDCHVKEPADFSYTTLKRNLDLSGTTFHRGIDFKSATFKYDATLVNAKFIAGKANFGDVRVRGVFAASGARFADGVEAKFNRAHFEKSAFFRRSTFECEANFGSVSINGQADFRGAGFTQKANFSGAKITGNGVFRAEPALGLPAATFEGDANFVDTQLGGTAEFQGVVFRQGVNFGRVQIAQGAFFLASLFEGEANFVGVQIGSQAAFQGARFTQKANFSGAKITDSAFFRAEPALGLPAATFEGEANFNNVQIDSNADFQGSRFNSKEAPATFNSAKINGHAFFRGATFEGEANFVGIHVGGQAAFQGTVFKEKTSFNSAKITDAAFFRSEPGRQLPAAIFEGEADFVSVQIGESAHFQEASFKQLVTFNRAQFGQSALFRRSTFEGEADFGGAHIGGAAEFQGATFKSKANFNRTRIASSAFFSPAPELGLPPARFDGEASFTSVHIGGQAAFHGVSFGSTGNQVSFDASRMESAVFFEGARFAGETRFVTAEILGSAMFRGATFLAGSKPNFNGTQFRQGAFFQGAQFEDSVDFHAAKFDVEARFRGVKFSGGSNFAATNFTGLALFNGGEDLPGAMLQAVSFDHARFEQDAHFEDVIFSGPTYFRETSFRVAYFSETGRAGDHDQFQGRVDLRGCTYERIQVNWKSLLNRVEPYDRQPYDQLEKVLRGVGQDRAAENVYLERRRVERMMKWGRCQFFSWLIDVLYALVARYGIRPYRLIGIALALLLLGTAFFSVPGSVYPKSEKVSCGSGTPIQLSWWQALGVSLNQFLPADIPMGSECVPSPEPVHLRIQLSGLTVLLKIPPSTFATILRLAGWILVPLGVGALTGLLRRVAQ